MAIDRTKSYLNEIQIERATQKLRQEIQIGNVRIVKVWCTVRVIRFGNYLSCLLIRLAHIHAYS